MHYSKGMILKYTLYIQLFIGLCKAMHTDELVLGSCLVKQPHESDDREFKKKLYKAKQSCVSKPVQSPFTCCEQWLTHYPKTARSLKEQAENSAPPCLTIIQKMQQSKLQQPQPNREDLEYQLFLKAVELDAKAQAEIERHCATRPKIWDELPDLLFAPLPGPALEDD